MKSKHKNKENNKKFKNINNLKNKKVNFKFIQLNSKIKLRSQSKLKNQFKFNHKDFHTLKNQLNNLITQDNE
jgi:hypothetical protein